jgi:3-oxoacyl-[acyl-carrier protein] reductase
VVRFTETLAEETRGDGIDVNAIAPGALNTRLLDQVLAAGSKLAGVAFYQQSIKQRDEGGAPVEKGARLCAFLLSTESDGITGKLISAVWDPWDHLPEHREQLNTSDIYTLRRIVPKDRGFGWGD